MRYNHMDMLPEMAFKPMGKRMTLEGGGGKGGGGGGSSQQVQGIDPMLKPYVQYGLNEATDLYKSGVPNYYPGQTYVSPSQQTQAALQAQQTRALQGNPLLPAAQQNLMNLQTAGNQAIPLAQRTASGAYLGSNPYFNAALQGAGQAATQQYFDAINAAQSGASQAGRYGSGAQENLFNRAGTSLAGALANKAGELAYNQYGMERGLQEGAIGQLGSLSSSDLARQLSASQAAPGLAMADYADINQLAQAGQTAEDYQQAALQSDIARFDFEQNLPYQKLSNFLGAVYGAPQGSVVQTSQQSSGGGKIVCSMMNEFYGTAPFRNKVWLAQSQRMPNAKTVEKGYHTLFLPLVAFAKKDGFFNKVVRKTLEHIARHRTADVYKEMRNGKRDILGRIYRAVLEPLCYVVGKLKGA